MTSSGIRIQPDWEKAILENDKKFWFHLYGSDRTRYQNIGLADGKFTPDTENVECQVVSSKTIRLKDTARRIQSTFQCPDVRFNTVHKLQREPSLRINAFDVNASGELAVSASSDKNVFLWETKTGEIRRSFEGHASEVYCSKFFPSGLVVLTGGSDFQLKIWSAINGECAATLKPGLGGAGPTSAASHTEPGGHQSGVVDMDFVDRGKNVVSVDRGGWLRLWDVASQIAISAISVAPRHPGDSVYANCLLADAPNCCLVKRRSWPSEEPQVPDVVDSTPTPTSLETYSSKAVAVGVTDCLVAVGTGSQRAETLLYDLSSAETRRQGPALRLTLPSTTGTITACATMSEGADGLSVFGEFGLVAGASSGQVACWDLRNACKPLRTYEACKSGGVAALKVCRFPAQTVEQASGDDPIRVPAFTGLLTAFSDGRTILRQFRTDVEPGSISRCLELTGPDVDCIRGVSVLLPGHPSSTSSSLWLGTNSGHFFNYRRLAVESLFT